MDAKTLIVDDEIWFGESVFFARIWFDTAERWTVFSLHRIDEPDSNLDTEQVRQITEADAKDMKALLDRVLPLMAEWDRVQEADPVRVLFGSHWH